MENEYMYNHVQNDDAPVITCSQKLKIYLGSIVSAIVTIAIFIAFFVTGKKQKI